MGKYDKNNSIQVRLGDLKAPLAEEAKKLDRSINWIIISSLKELSCIKEFYRKTKKSCED